MRLLSNVLLGMCACVVSCGCPWGCFGTLCGCGGCGDCDAYTVVCVKWDECGAWDKRSWWSVFEMCLSLGSVGGVGVSG